MSRDQEAALGCAGLFLAWVVVFLAAAAFWSWVLMLVVNAVGIPWGFWHCVTPWGLLMSLAFGTPLSLFTRRGR